MFIFFFWMMLLGNLVSEIALAFAVPQYRQFAMKSLKNNLIGSLSIALFWATFIGTIGGGGAITAALLPIVVPISMVLTIPLYQVLRFHEAHKDQYAEYADGIKVIISMVWKVVEVITWPLRAAYKALVWLDQRTNKHNASTQLKG